MTTSERENWEQVAQELDMHYTEERNALRRAVDRIFRKAMTERFQLTLQECKDVKGKRVLDIGCGGGHMAIQLAKRGAFVVGFDSSQNMINKATAITVREGLQNRCVFVRGDFTKHLFKEDFDISVALGFFDYAQDSASNIKKMSYLTTEKCIMSFSAKFAFQVPLRVLWLRGRRHPVYFYSKKQLKRLLSPHFSHYRIKNISGGYHCVGIVRAHAVNYR